MKHFYILLSTLILVSCGTPSGHFKIEGHFLHLNQGELYVYSPDNIIQGMDTVRINGGRFAYEIPCKEEGTLVIVFPNYSEHPVFTQSGKGVNIKADASHLKQMRVEGTKTNELMNTFRAQIETASPPEAQQRAQQFIKDHPESLVSVWLVRKYFIQQPNADYRQAAKLVDLLLKEQPKNGVVNQLSQALKQMQGNRVGDKLTNFSATDIDGRRVSKADLNGKVSVIFAWATWSYESQDLQRRLKALKKDYGSKLGVVGIGMDASKRDCRNAIRYDSLKWSTICEERVFESPTFKTLCLGDVPDNIVVDKQGKIVARNLNSENLEKKLKEMLR